MRTSGKGSDLTVVLVPLVVLIAVGVALAGDDGHVFATVEKRLWDVLHTVGRWVSSLLA